MLELHPSEFVIDSLYNNFSSLVEFLTACLFSGLTSLFNELHELFFFQLTRELALSINLVVLFLPMRFLVSLKYMLNNLVTSTASSFVAGYCCRLELLMLFGFFTSSKAWRVGIVIPGSIRGWFMLFQDLRVQKFERDQRIIDEGFQNSQE